MTRRLRRRRWIALVALLALLFQQLAMAAYVCPGVPERAMDAVAASLPPCHQRPEAADATRCFNHCHPQPTTSDHPPAPTVPDALVPPTTWLRAVARQGVERPDCAAAEITARAAAPPLNVRYCSFQI